MQLPNGTKIKLLIDLAVHAPDDPDHYTIVRGSIGHIIEDSHLAKEGTLYHVAFIKDAQWLVHSDEMEIAPHPDN